MQIEFLGTGGGITTPRPGCNCTICVQARQQGVPYSRCGPSIFIHGPNILIDTPEEIKVQLNRSEIRHIPACFYSHWHPDHTMGRRIWEMNYDWTHWPPRNQRTDIYMPQQVALDFHRRLGTWEHLVYLEQLGLVRLRQLGDGDVVKLNGYHIRPIRLAEEYVYAFLIEGEGRRLLVMMDEIFGWEPTGDLKEVDLAIMPMGLTEFNPLTGERHIPEDHPVLQHEATFLQTLDIIRRLKPKRVILTHIEEPDRLSHDDLQFLAGRLRSQGLNIDFAYDTWRVEV